MKYYILLFLTAFMGVATAQQKNDTVKIKNTIKLPFGSIDKNKLVGAVDVIKGEDLLHSSDYNVESTLAGQAPGLFIFKGNGAPGIDATSMKIRGLSRGNRADSPLIVIDGIANRALSSISIDEIESIEVLKDITAKMLYGSKAANGVLMVTTKRGYEGKRKFTFFHESGTKTPSVLPEYINSRQYKTLYNQALINDGLDASVLTQSEIDKYSTSSLLYPDVDHYDEFLKSSTNFSRFNAQLIGGSDATKYFLNLGYTSENGLEKVGRNQSFNRINVRSNLDFKVNNVVSMFLDIAGRLDNWDRADMTNEQFFQRLSSHRPDDYPIWFGNKGDADFLGYSERVDNNLAGDLMRSGYVNSKNYYAQTNVGMNFDLDQYVKGLSLGGYVTFDVYNRILLGKRLGYSRIELGDTFASDPTDYTRIGSDVLDDSERRLGDDVRQNIGLVANVDYTRTWGKSDLQASLVAMQQTYIFKATLDGPTAQQDDKNMNIGLRANYTYNNKYTAEVSSSYMGSDKFTKDNRWGLFGSGGLGWIISNEDFLKGSSAVNFLKLKGTYGVMGYDRSFDYLLDQDYFIANGNYRTGPKGANSEAAWRAGQIGNKNLTFEKSREYNIGVEASLFNNKVDLELNYFNEYRYDMPVVLTNALPDLTGQLRPVGNYNELSNKGVDFFIKYKDNIGDLKFALGANFIYAKAVNEVFDEVNPYNHLNRTGKAADTGWGWLASGLYQNDTDIANHGVTSQYGNIIPGDVKLENITNDRGDNIIDPFDMQAIGNTFPRINYALNLNLEYKGFELFAIGQGVSGLDRMLNNSYYWNVGDNKYSVQALGSAVPGSVSGATSPRLTTLNQSHSYRNSTYWLRDGAYFKLRTVELGYTIPQFATKKLGADKFKVFIRGNDLITISKIKDSDPENLNTGVTSYPMYKTISLGLKLTY